MMNFTATIVNDTIRLPSGLHFPDGTQVIVAPFAAAERIPGVPISQSLEPFIGIGADLPADLARNHDHYVHGRAKES